MWEFVSLRQFIPVDSPFSFSSDLLSVFTKSCIHHGIPFLCVRLGKVHTVTNVSMKPFSFPDDELPLLVSPVETNGRRSRIDEFPGKIDFSVEVRSPLKFVASNNPE